MGETITLNRIHVGDVWLVAGQSNARKHAKLQLPDGCSGYSGFGPTNKGIYPDDVWQSLIDIRRQWVSHGQVSRFGAAFAIEMHEQLQIPIGIASIAFPGTPIQSWYSSAGHPKAVGSTAKWVRKLPPATMAKEWVRPLYRMPARGVVWWQGESNVPAHADYADHLQRMIAEWRSGRGDPDMPFIIVKLQSIATESAADLEAMRAAQEAAAKSAGNCILVESADLAASGDVHPPPEELASIGRRAAAMYIAATPSLGRNSP
ncbi:sialate O-acetylesterase [uncultured Azohydromonas sp.]|uniref:sialate O-acetylesterase n=1 Tax=uncultured Azohydromonas sp. TaxID=487342 RepID=UPI00261DE13B|nr:sialate O-acetylesterase [uncultured Azohydromonas sp.]